MNDKFSEYFQRVRPLMALGDRSLSTLAKQRSSRFHAMTGRRPARPTDRLFLAALPDMDTAERISDLARRLRIGHDLKGKPLQPAHFHVTLHHVGDSDTAPPTALIDAILDKLSSVAVTPAFRVGFDRAGSFKNGAYVLRGDDRLLGLEILQQRVADALDARPQTARPFTPHVTLLRDRHLIPEHDIEPIEWTVKEVVLVHSLLGRTTHRHVAKMSLG